MTTASLACWSRLAFKSWECGTMGCKPYILQKLISVPICSGPAHCSAPPWQHLSHLQLQGSCLYQGVTGRSGMTRRQ